MKTAQISAEFDRKLLTLPRQASSFNDDVYIEAYRPAILTNAGRQQKRIHELLDSCRSFDEHIRCALKETFPFSISTPLPQDTSAAAYFARDMPADKLVLIWDAQLSSLEQRVANCSLAQQKWDETIHPDLRPAAGKFRTVAIKQLMRQHGMGGQHWLGQFAVGFPITGRLSQLHTYEVDDSVIPPLNRDQLYDTAVPRFRERAAKSGHKNAQVLWDEAMAQVKSGWLMPPPQLHPGGRPFAWKSSRFNICFRFGVEQADKLRACDDLKHSMTNLACTVHTPIQLVSRGHITQLANFLAGDGGDWVMFKADHEAAYKQLPLNPLDMRNAIVALRDPTSKRWYGFVSRTLVFGSADAVLHYNIFPRIITALTNRCLGIALVGYFDDFAALIKKHLRQKALETFTRICPLLGIRIKPGKSEVGSPLTFLGLLGTFPCAANGRRLSISLTPGKRKRWPGLITGYLNDGRVAHSFLEKLIGKLLFSQVAVFGKFARTQLRPLYTKLHRRVYNARLSAYERSVFT